MSFALPTIDLTAAQAAGAGFTASILLQNMGIGAGGVSANPSNVNNMATLYAYNDSGCGLQLNFQTSGNSFVLPAGGWRKIPLVPGEAKVDYLVTYILPNPPVSKLLLEYFAPGENVPDLILGNSPVGVGGTIATSFNSLSNEGNAIGTLVIDIGPTGNANIINIFNDHFTWSVVQAGVAHTVLQGQTSGNPLLIGKSGDIAEVLGQLLVDQDANFSGALDIANNQSIQWKSSGGALARVLAVDASNNTILQAKDSNVILFKDNAANEVFRMTSGGINTVLGAGTNSITTQNLTTNGTIGCGGGYTQNGGDMALGAHNITSVNDITLNGNYRVSSTGVYRYRNGNTLQNICFFTGSGTGTYNHGNGEAPFHFMITSDVVGSATYGYDTITSTQVHVTQGSTMGFRAMGVN